jgi:hypothetical protein
MVAHAVGAFGQAGHVDGALDVARFNSPIALCLDEDSHFVADHYGNSIRCVNYSATNTVKRVTPLIVAALPIVPKELAAIIADYSHSLSGVSTIAGTPGAAGVMDGHALREAKFSSTAGLAIDDSDPVAGPALIICDYGNHRGS